MGSSHNSQGKPTRLQRILCKLWAHYEYGQKLKGGDRIPCVENWEVLWICSPSMILEVSGKQQFTSPEVHFFIWHLGSRDLSKKSFIRAELSGSCSTEIKMKWEQLLQIPTLTHFCSLPRSPQHELRNVIDSFTHFFTAWHLTITLQNYLTASWQLPAGACAGMALRY